MLFLCELDGKASVIIFMKIALKKLEFNSLYPNDVYDVIDGISRKYEPILYSIKKEYWKKLALPEEGFKEWFIDGLKKLPLNSSCGDLIMIASNSLYFYKFVFDENCVYVGLISDGDNDANYDSFCSELKRLFENTKLSVSSDWFDVSFDPDILEAIKEQSQLFAPTNADISAAKYLEEETSRKFLEKISATTGVSLSKIVSQSEMAKFGPIVDHFEKEGIITKDFVVLCSKTGQPILKVSSRSALDETPQGTNKCFICGNPLSKETIDEIISCSDFGKRLIAQGYWLEVRMFSILKRLGVPAEGVMVWSDTVGISYMFSMINAQAYLFVLCSNPITLEDVYNINVYTSAYSVENLLIASTDKIPLLVKKQLEEFNLNKTSVSFAESLSSLDDSVELFVVGRGSDYVSKLLNSFIDLTPVSIHELIISMFSNNAPVIVKQEDNIESIDDSDKKGRKKNENKKADKPLVEADEIVTSSEIV